MAHAAKKGGNAGTSQRSTAEKKTSAQRTENQAVVSRSSRPVAQRGTGQTNQTLLAPKGYTMRPIQPAKNYDVISFARAMNDDFGSKVKKLFDPEREAALEAQETGIYIGWRCPEFKWDCQRVGQSSRCFCGHSLAAHHKYNGQSVCVPCRQPGCGCKAFAFVPARPEDVGEYWLPKRRNFNPATWRLNCRCKHNHEEHDVNGQHRCLKCSCRVFTSYSVCAACDRHWEQHETFFETERDRKEKGLPYGEDYLPFAEIKSLRNMVLTGEDDGDMSYMRKQERQLKPGRSADSRALPPPHSTGTTRQPADSQYNESEVVPFGGSTGQQRHTTRRQGPHHNDQDHPGGGFRPTYN